MTASEPLTVLRQTIPPGYTDYNQHMADGYYLVVFSDATTGLMDHIGLGPAERERGVTRSFERSRSSSW
jgi:acyl-CoA thioester hydrolase